MNFSLGYIQKKPKVLDIGTGAGFDAKYLSDHNCEVISIDLSEEFLKIAKEIAPKVQFIKMDARGLNFEDNSFDGIWASASLLHLPKNEILSVLKKIYSILNDDGIFFIGMKKGEGEKFVENSSKGVLKNDIRYYSFFSKDELEKYLRERNFKIEKYSENNTIWMIFYCSKLPSAK